MLIVALDGGIFRALLQARLLERLSDEVPGWLTRVQFFAGSSMGAVTAAYAAKTGGVKGLAQTYAKNGPLIFRRREFYGQQSGPPSEKATYDQAGLLKVLRSLFSDYETLGELYAKCMVTTFSLDNRGAKQPRTWQAKYYDNWDQGSVDSQTRILDLLRRSTAVPGYFPSYQGHLSGAVVDSNPAAAALAKAVAEGFCTDSHSALMADVRGYLGTLHLPLANAYAQQIKKASGDRIRLLSVGTGLSPAFVEGDNLDLGRREWAKDRTLTRALMDGKAGPPDYICRKLLGEDYRRLQPVLPCEIRHDDHEAAEKLLEVADAVDISEVVDWLRERTRPQEQHNGVFAEPKDQA